MLASDMISILNNYVESYGDLPIVGGYIMDETKPSSINAINADGVIDDNFQPTEDQPEFVPIGLFIT